MCVLILEISLPPIILFISTFPLPHIHSHFQGLYSGIYIALPHFHRRIYSENIKIKRVY